MIKIIAKIKLFFIKLQIMSEGGLAKPQTWRQYYACKEILETKGKDI